MTRRLPRSDRCGRRRHRQRHGGRGLRLDRLLRCRWCAWRDRRGATDQDGTGCLDGRPRSTARDRTIKKVRAIGRRRWKKASGYHRQARVENVFFRYKSIIGDGLRARSPAGQGTEAVLACNILNQMTQRGRPASYAIGR